MSNKLDRRSYGVMVITLRFERGDLGSIPSRTYNNPVSSVGRAQDF